VQASAGRRALEEISVFKSVGASLEDLAAAALAIEIENLLDDASKRSIAIYVFCVGDRAEGRVNKRYQSWSSCAFTPGHGQEGGGCARLR
jgi:hypothetical protein